MGTAKYVSPSVQEAVTHALDVTASRDAALPVRYTTFWSLTLFVSDVAMFVVAAYLAGAIVDHDWGIGEALARLVHSSFVFIAVWTLIFYALGLYQWSLALSIKDEFYFVVIALVLGVVPQLLFFTALPALSTSRLALILSAAIAIGLVGSSRATIHLLRAAKQGRSSSCILVIGDDAGIATVCGNLTQKSAGNSTVLTLNANAGLLAGESAITTAKAWFDVARNSRCDRVILTNASNSEATRQFLALCENSKIQAMFALPAIELGAYGLEVERDHRQNLLVPVRPKIARPMFQLGKRIFDMTFGLLAVALTLPIMVATAAAVWLDSGSPVLYRQERVGRFGRIFKIFKFRTMKVNSDSSWAKPGDARITKLGALLRRTSIDELPQFFNVLAGDMSLVGPRPEMRVFEETFAARIPSYTERRLALPGITGWAQVNVKRNLTPDDVEEVLSYDLFYIEHWSLFLDLTVLLKTVTEFLFHRAV